MIFQYLNSRIVILKGGTSKIGIGYGNTLLWINALIKQVIYTRLPKQKSIIPPLFNTIEVNNILLQKVSFHQLKQRHISQGLIQDLLNFPSTSFHSSYSYTLRPIHG